VLSGYSANQSAGQAGWKAAVPAELEEETVEGECRTTGAALRRLDYTVILFLSVVSVSCVGLGDNGEPAGLTQAEQHPDPPGNPESTSTFTLTPAELLSIVGCGDKLTAIVRDCAPKNVKMIAGAVLAAAERDSGALDSAGSGKAVVELFAFHLARNYARGGNHAGAITLYRTAIAEFLRDAEEERDVEDHVVYLVAMATSYLSLDEPQESSAREALCQAKSLDEYWASHHLGYRDHEDKLKGLLAQCPAVTK
jgi:hypothetical protein